MQTTTSPPFYDLTDLLIDYSNSQWLEQDTTFTEHEKDQIFIFVLEEATKPEHQSLFITFVSFVATA